ncbi:hypothetical protein D3C81_1512290 [compost metagenome]
MSADTGVRCARTIGASAPTHAIHGFMSVASERSRRAGCRLRIHCALSSLDIARTHGETKVSYRCWLTSATRRTTSKARSSSRPSSSARISVTLRRSKRTR